MEDKDLIEHQKGVAKVVIGKLQVLDMWAILAGGACRDWYLGRPATDLDFYLHYSTKYPQWALCEHFGNLLDTEFKIIGKQGEGINGDSEVTYTSDPNIEFVLGGIKDGVEIQIIIIKSPYMSVTDFCFDICQAFTRNVDDIETTKAFDEAVSHKVIRITGQFYAKKDAYTTKIKNKFPDYLHIGF